MSMFYDYVQKTNVAKTKASNTVVLLSTLIWVRTL